jgi:hypothetical protein
VLVEDTDALMVAALLRHAAGVPVTAFEDVLDIADCYVLLHPSAPEPLPSRPKPGRADERLHRHCLEVLVSKGARHVISAGSREERNARAEQALASLMSEPFHGRWMHVERHRFSSRVDLDDSA